MSTLVKERENVQKTIRLTPHPMLGRIEKLKHRIEYRRMVDFEDREAIYHLRRNAYSRHKGEAANWGASEIEPPHEPNSVTIGLFIDSRLVGSFKIMVATKEYPDCQSRKFFPTEVDKLLNDGHMLLDPVRFVADTKATSDFPELPFLLYKVVIMACQYFDAEICLSFIRKDHSSFYRRIFYSQTVAEPVWYPPLEIDLMLMGTDIPKVLGDVLQRFPCWKADHLEMRQVFGPLSDWPAVVQRIKQAA